MGWRSKGWGPGNENQYGVRRTQFPLRFAPPARVRARRSRPAPCLEGGLTYRPGLDRGQHSLSDTAIRKREGERVDPASRVIGSMWVIYSLAGNNNERYDLNLNPEQ
jgi:hypothetical protein